MNAFWRALVQFQDQDLVVVAVCATGGVGGEARAIGIVNDPRCLHRCDAGR